MKDLNELRRQIEALLAHVEDYDLVPPDSIDLDWADEQINVNWHLTRSPLHAKAVLRSFGEHTWSMPQQSIGSDIYLTRPLPEGGEITVWMPEGTVALKVVIE